MSEPAPKIQLPVMAPVESKQIKEIGHDADQNHLYVRFHNGGTYRYHGVSAEKHAELMGADSHGSHLHKHIKGVHEYERLPEQTEQAFDPGAPVPD